MKTIPLVSPLFLAALVTAQDKVDLSVVDAKSPIKVSIQSSSKSVNEIKMTVDGEPMQGGRGPAGPTKQSRNQTVVFVEGPGDGHTWREYQKLTATTARPDDTGGTDNQETEGGLIGKQLQLVQDDRGVSAKLDGEELPAMVARQLPGRLSFQGITPKTPVAIGEEFELSAAFLESFKQLNHPVLPAAMLSAGRRGEGGPGAPGGQGGRRRPGAGGEGDQGGQGGEPAAGQPRGRQRGQGGQAGQGGQGGQRAGFAGRMGGFGGGMSGAALLSNPNLEGKIVAKLESVDGDVAKISFQGARKGEGSLQDLGIGLGALGGGRGGRGGAGGGGFAMEGEGAAEVTLAGELWIDTQAHRVVKLVVEGKASQETLSERDMGDRGLMEIEAKGADEFRLVVETESAPAPKKADGESKDKDGR
jgi:hypothetical protein